MRWDSKEMNLDLRGSRIYLASLPCLEARKNRLTNLDIKYII